MSNHYETLGVQKDASEAEIKKAYRGLSLKFHPDRNSDPDAKTKFQEINSAYEVIGDPESKAQYDSPQNVGGFPPGFPFPGGFPGGGDDIHNIFSQFFGGGGVPGMNIHMNTGGHPGVRIFHGGNPHQEAQQNHFNIFQQLQKPPPIIKNIEVSLEQSYHGASVSIEIERWKIQDNIKIIERETVYINVPKGIDNGDFIVVNDVGNMNGNLKGDIKIGVTVNTDNSIFHRQGLDLIYNKVLTLKESLCGFSFEIQHLNGKKISFENVINPTIIKPNTKRLFPNNGLTREGSSSQGNLIIDFDVEFPDTLTLEQINVLKDIM
jgi:DnaJ-class molecular chaperone